MGITPKRRFVRAALRTVATLPDRFPLSEVALLRDLHGMSGVEAALTSAAESLGGIPSLWPVVFWPAQYRRARVYLHLLDDHARPVGFLKLAQADGAQALWRERDALVFWDGGHGAMRTPRVLASVIEPESAASWLLVEPLPVALRPVGESELASLLGMLKGTSRHVPQHELPSLSWWPGLQRQLLDAPMSFRDCLMQVMAQGIEVARVHGDLGAKNAVAAGSQVWLYDWEHSASDGPAEFDRLTLQLLEQRPTDAVRRVASWSQLERDDFVWSCAFALANQNGQNGSWRRFLDSWTKVREWYL